MTTKMFPSSPSYQFPVTPAAFRNPLQFRPMNSSPLAESPGKSSPVVAAQARRKSQYKSLSPMTPLSVRSTSGGRQLSHRSASEGTRMSGFSAGGADDALREKFRSKCIERAVKQRERAIRGKRTQAPREPNSDDYNMEDDDSEDDDAIMQDELFRRIMANTNRKEQHAFKVSYARDVGSSFDPAIDEVDAWEQELTASTSANPRAVSVPAAGPSRAVSGPPSSSLHPDEEEEIPLEFDDAELEAYAQEASTLEGYDDIPDEFTWSDLEDFENAVEDPRTPVAHRPDEDDMDVS